MSDSPEFDKNIENILKNMHRAFDHIQIATKAESFCRIYINDAIQVDFVNDVPFHYGKFNKFPLFNRVDNVINILSNKIVALQNREEPKDIVDIWVICKHNKIDWPEIFSASDSKAAGIYAPAIAKKIEEFPLNLIDAVRWINKPKKSDIADKLRQITRQIIRL